MLKQKISNFFYKILAKDKLYSIDGRKLISSNNIVEELTISQFESLKQIKDLTNEDLIKLMKNGYLSSSEKVLLLDILSLFNSLEVNFNRILGMNGNSCAGISAILNSASENPSYNNIFQTEIELSFKKNLQEYIEVRHLIAHGVAKKHINTNSILFITSNKNDWNKKVKHRKKNLQKFSDRPDKQTLLSDMGERSIIYAVTYVPFLEYLRSTLKPIEKYFSEKTALETRH